MREIKFRGATRDGAWVYGSYAGLAGGPFILDGLKAHAVIPDSVGQYTGYKDADGAEVYEGDLLACEYFDGLSCKVTWVEDGWMCVCPGFDDDCLLSTAIAYGAVIAGKQENV